MAKRIKIWPPGGGDPITVYEVDAGRLIMNGWTTEKSGKKAKKKADPVIETETTEVQSNGNTARK